MRSQQINQNLQSQVGAGKIEEPQPKILYPTFTVYGTWMELAVMDGAAPCRNSTSMTADISKSIAAPSLMFGYSQILGP